MATLKDNARLPTNPVDRAHALGFNAQLVACRQAAEWGMRSIQGSFGRLRLPLDANDDGKRRDLLEICMRLHNLRTRLVGINQIRNTYMPIWMASDTLWETFGDTLFTEIARSDRINRFYNAE